MRKLQKQKMQGNYHSVLLFMIIVTQGIEFLLVRWLLCGHYKRQGNKTPVGNTKLLCK